MEKTKKTALMGAMLALFSVFVCIVAFCVMMDAFSVSAAPTNPTISGYEDQIKDLEDKGKELQGEINALKNDSSKALELRKMLDQQLSVTHEKIDAANALVSELETQIKMTSDGIGELEDNLEHQKKVFIDRLRLAYEESDVSYIAMLFDADGLTDFFGNIERVGALLDYDKKIMDSYSEKKSDLENKKSDLDAQYAKQIEYQATLAKTKDELALQLREAENLLDSIKKDQDKYQSQLNAIKDEEKKLEAELEEYIKKLQEEQNKDYMVAGQLQWPIKEGTAGYNRITSRFGNRDLTVDGNDVSNHKGIDIGVRYVDILACGPGTVITSTYSESYGFYIIIDHGGGVSTLYAHLSKLGVKKGAEVKGGQKIGVSGSTGWSDGPHLHLELRLKGAKVDPLETKDKYGLLYLSRPNKLLFPYG